MSFFHPIYALPYTTIVPTDDVIVDNPTERTTNSTSYVRVKESRIFCRGKIRVYFEIHTTSSGYAANGWVYRNGVAVGTERSTTSTTYVSFTEDIDGWFEGDCCQIYGKIGTTAQTCYIRNQQIKGQLTRQILLLGCAVL
jgi:hypothetical protein